MEIYTLEANGSNNGDYEDYWFFDEFYGVFSTIEKAKEYAEKLMEQKRKNTREVDQWGEDGHTPLSYHETFQVDKDWYDYEGNVLKKEVSYGEGYTDEWTVTYYITKVTVDPEFKEDK